MVLVADMEAGLEHLSWAGGTLRHVDLLLVVIHAQAKILLTARRTVALARQLGIPEVAFVANRIRAGEAGDEDRARLTAFAEEHGGEILAWVPEDDALVEADRRGECVLDHAPQAPAVAAIVSLADRLEGRIGAPAAAPERTG
ncbi:MAG TPA: hypothetical protein VM264_00045 [Acidimicrobiales bacterium]|nr:hypothetical protein [Acidimicrobiales bacterium]